MKFTFESFSCDVDVFLKDQDIIIRFYDRSREQEEEEIINLVIVDPGFGYLCLKVKGEDALLSGYLDESIFQTNEIVDAAIEFIQDLSPSTKNCYMPYHVALFRRTSFIEYNGEY